LNKKLSETLNLDFGIDARTYRGYHYTVVNDLLGGNEYFDNTNVNIRTNSDWSAYTVTYIVLEYLKN
jgi:hypothetical protein